MMVIGSVLIVAPAVGAFANGMQDGYSPRGFSEGDAPGAGAYGRNRGPQVIIKDEEAVTITGTLQLTDDGPATLTVDGEIWALGIPPFAASGNDVESGDTVTVTGYAHDEVRPYGGEDTNHLRIITAEIDGETVDLELGYARGGSPRGRMAFDDDQAARGGGRRR